MRAPHPRNGAAVGRGECARARLKEAMLFLEYSYAYVNFPAIRRQRRCDTARIHKPAASRLGIDVAAGLTRAVDEVVQFDNPRT